MVIARDVTRKDFGFDVLKTLSISVKPSVNQLDIFENSPVFVLRTLKTVNETY